MLKKAALDSGSIPRWHFCQLAVLPTIPPLCQHQSTSPSTTARTSTAWGTVHEKRSNLWMNQWTFDCSSGVTLPIHDFKGFVQQPEEPFISDIIKSAWNLTYGWTVERVRWPPARWYACSIGKGRPESPSLGFDIRERWREVRSCRGNAESCQKGRIFSPLNSLWLSLALSLISDSWSRALISDSDIPLRLDTHWNSILRMAQGITQKSSIIANWQNTTL